MTTQTLVQKKVLTTLEVEKLRAELLEKRLGILPVEVTETGYYYDPDELFAALEKNPPINFDDSNTKF